jgi:signal transduction histidine kinase
VRGGLTARLVGASGSLVLVIGVAFVVLLLAVGDLRDTTRLSRHSQEVLATAHTLEGLVIDLETGERGFLITGDERFLNPWEAARVAIPGVSRDLVRLAVVPAQDRRARQIAAAIGSYLRDYAVPLVAAARRNDASARSRARADEGKRLVDGIRARFDRLTAAERRLGAARLERSDSAARRAVLAVTIGLVGSLLLVLFIAGYLTRAIVQPVRRAATMAGRLAGGDLTVRMLETGAGEIGALESAFNTMGTNLEASRDELRRLAEEQAALRRVATLVARDVAPAEIFSAVAEEVRRSFGADDAAIACFEPDGAASVVAGVGPDLGRVPAGARWESDGPSATTAVFQTGRAARAAPDDELGIPAVVAGPIVVGGRLWGAAIVSTARAPLPPDAEMRLASFTDLVGTAVANADGRAALAASRARVVAASDETRHRIERDLHDGTQQRLVSLGLQLRSAQATVPPGLEELEEQLSQIGGGLADALETLQEISRGIHPAILSEGGLGPALRALARRAAVPVELDVRTDRRLPEHVERAAYYVASEALANTAKHAHASVVHVELEAQDTLVRLAIRDDGVGGAKPGQGSGLIGLTDRVEALGGSIEIVSRPGAGTSLVVTIPVQRGE